MPRATLSGPAHLDNNWLTREQLIIEFTESPEFRASIDEEALLILKADAAQRSATDPRRSGL